jgi:hypothetical protein
MQGGDEGFRHCPRHQRHRCCRWPAKLGASLCFVHGPWAWITMRGGHQHRMIGNRRLDHQSPESPGTRARAVPVCRRRATGLNQTGRQHQQRHGLFSGSVTRRQEFLVKIAEGNHIGPTHLVQRRRCPDHNTGGWTRVVSRAGQFRHRLTHQKLQIIA